MDCPSCFDLYDEEERCPRNLPCGHTYCELCLDKILALTGKLECPVCRIKLPPKIVPSQLSKNYIAASLALKQRELQKKLLFCQLHREPMKLFCENCQENICPSCIIDHSGHSFIKQEHSVELLKERAVRLKDSLNKQMEKLNREKETHEMLKSSAVKQKEEHLKAVDDEFDKIIKKLNERRVSLKEEYEKCVNDELRIADNVYSKRASFAEKFSVLQADTVKLLTTFESTKVIQGTALIKNLEEAEEMFNVHSKSFATSESLPTIQLPIVLFDPSHYQEITQIGFISKEIRSPKLFFFGERNKILLYDIEQETWKLHHLPKYLGVEFNYYHASCVLPSGDIMMSGGGISNTVYVFSVSKFEICVKKPMKQVRKEHALVYLNNCVYALGGYDGINNAFLSTCEKYDLEKDEWNEIKPMVFAKCAFGACAINNRYIFTVGGYNGTFRLDTIERFDSETQEWSIFNTRLHEALSNIACFSAQDNSFTLLGGGHDNGFSLEVWTLDIEKEKWKEEEQMSEGRDLRNKISVIGGYVYAIGGNECKGERFSLSTGKWSPLPAYHHLVNDNLDSWCCALGYEIEGKTSKNKNTEVCNQSFQFAITNKMDFPSSNLEPWFMEGWEGDDSP